MNVQLIRATEVKVGMFTEGGRPGWWEITGVGSYVSGCLRPGRGAVVTEVQSIVAQAQLLRARYETCKQLGYVHDDVQSLSKGIGAFARNVLEQLNDHTFSQVDRDLIKHEMANLRIDFETLLAVTKARMGIPGP